MNSTRVRLSATKNACLIKSSTRIYRGKACASAGLPQTFGARFGQGLPSPFSRLVHTGTVPSTSNVNKVSQNAYNSIHKSYDTYRSGYPDSAVELAACLNHLNQGQNILEVAAGTGKFTSQILSHIPADRTIVLEPSQGMLSSFREKHPDIKAVQASSDCIPFEDNSFDTIYVAQAFHWFANRDSLKELHRVLRPEGRLVLVWNYEDEKHMLQGGWQKRTTDLVWQYDSNVPQYRHKKWEVALKNNKDLFSSYCERLFPYRELVESPQALWSYWETRSYIHELEVPQQKQLKQSIIDIAQAAPAPLLAARGCHVVWMSSTKKSTTDILPKRI